VTLKLISVDEALAKIFALARPANVEYVQLSQAAGRVLIKPVKAMRDQPPFSASAMDGYAVQTAKVRPGATFKVIGESAAGHGFAGSVGPDEAVRIFTGAPVPVGADRVIIQEDVTRTDGLITLSEGFDTKAYIRNAGADFRIGDQIDAPRRLGPTDLALLAAMNIAQVPVARRPVVALIATGDELVMPSEAPGEDQIIASNTFGLQAMFGSAGAEVRILPIARDTAASLRVAFTLARDADLIVTIGGASVGDHDLVAPVAQEFGMERAFYRVAMRPGKPLMAGRLGQSAMIGLPGNPVSSMVCGAIFVVPLIHAMLGLGAMPVARYKRPLAASIAENGPREHYMRAKFSGDGIAALDRQDSALLSVLAQADALLIRPPNDGPRTVGEMVDYIPLQP
jgi:molybdopterin molybdotransferase